MAQVSNKELRKDVLLRIHKQFSNILLDLKNTNQGLSFLNELLTDTEKIMLAKRLAVIIMLTEKIPHSTIAQLLGMTRVTVLKYAKLIDLGGYISLKNILKKRKDQEELWLTLCKLARGGLPPYSGRGRWNYIYKQTEHLQKRQKT